MSRIVFDLKTGQQVVVPLTPEEEADAVARTAAEQAEQAPIIAARSALIAAKAEAQADNIVQYLRDHTPAECAQYVQDNVTDLASAKAFLKKVAIVLCVLSKESFK